jgi:hypothetical protein
MKEIVDSNGVASGHNPEGLLESLNPTLPRVVRLSAANPGLEA